MGYFGDFAIFIATACTVGSGVMYVLAWRGRIDLINVARQLFRASTGLLTVALMILLYQIVTHDFSNAYVYQYSSTDLPTNFLVAVLWAGQEGTFLLWIFMAGLMGLVMMVRSAEFESGNMLWLNIFILSVLVILLKRSPFEMLSFYAIEGNGLNPLLQNYWMTIHPPIMFIGFAATTIPFCYAMTALVDRRYNSWGEAARGWTLFAWSGLGISLVLGGYWAYETLGWGGFWAWDPVENSSLIPWLFLTAQTHTLFIKRHRRGLLRFSMVIVFLSFWSVLYGTFLTRSGVLADFSVHSFVDLGINQFLIAGLIFFVGIGSYMLALRWKDIKVEPSFSKVDSRSYMTALGIVILFVSGTLVLMGTSAPLLTSFSENPSSVELSYYFTTMTPIAILLLILISISPAFRWNQGLSKPLVLAIGGISMSVSIAVLMILSITTEIIYLLLFGTAIAALVTNVFVFAKSWIAGHFKAGYLSHVGLALAIIGAAASAGFETKQKVNLIAGETVLVEGYELTYTGLTERKNGFDCHMTVEKEGEIFHATLANENTDNGIMRKPHVENFLFYDIYLSPLALKQSEDATPGLLFIKRDEETEIDSYTVKFLGFEMGEHGDVSANEMMAGAVLEVSFDGKTETVKPYIHFVNDQATPYPAKFDSGRGQVIITDIIPAQEGVELQISGEFVPKPVISDGILVVEMAKKPFILFFWIGTLLVFVSGLLSMTNYKGRLRPDQNNIAVLHSNKETETVLPGSQV